MEESRSYVAKINKETEEIVAKIKEESRLEVAKINKETADIVTKTKSKKDIREIALMWKKDPKQFKENFKKTYK